MTSGEIVLKSKKVKRCVWFLDRGFRVGSSTSNFEIRFGEGVVERVNVCVIGELNFESTTSA